MTILGGINCSLADHLNACLDAWELPQYRYACFGLDLGFHITMFLTPFSSFKRRRTQSNELDELWTSIEYQKLAQAKLNCKQVSL